MFLKSPALKDLNERKKTQRKKKNEIEKPNHFEDRCPCLTACGLFCMGTCLLGCRLCDMCVNN